MTTNKAGRFGIHGGQYIPETLMNAVNELERAYNFYRNDSDFNAELTRLFNDYPDCLMIMQADRQDYITQGE